MRASYEIKVQPGAGHTHLEIIGEVGPGMAGGVTKAVMGIFAHNTSIKVLVDVRNLTVRVGPIETVHMVSSYRDMVARTRYSKTAVLHSEANYGVLRFYETVALNRGYSTALFTEMTEAMRWLEQPGTGRVDPSFGVSDFDHDCPQCRDMQTLELPRQRLSQ